jgi:hypothetical protein
VSSPGGERGLAWLLWLARCESSIETGSRGSFPHFTCDPQAPTNGADGEVIARVSTPSFCDERRFMHWGPMTEAPMSRN